MKRSDFKKASAIMGKLKDIDARGSHDFSNVIGDDSFEETDGYYEDYDGEDNYEDEYFARPQRRKQGSNRNVANVPQTDLIFTLTNQIGLVGLSGKSATTYSKTQVAFFGATKNSLATFPALGLTQFTPVLNAQIDGFLFQGQGVSSNASDVDLVLSSETTTYSQIFGDSRTSPFVAKGIRLDNTNTTQLRTTFQVVTVDSLGALKQEPYTPQSKKSAFQFDPTIIEDDRFNILLDGDKALYYNTFAPGQGGTTAGQPNAQRFTMFLFRQADIAKAVRGGKPITNLPRYGGPAAQPLRIQK
jgi:hypothetical protein